MNEATATEEMLEIYHSILSTLQAEGTTKGTDGFPFDCDPAFSKPAAAHRSGAANLRGSGGAGAVQQAVTAPLQTLVAQIRRLTVALESIGEPPNPADQAELDKRQGPYCEIRPLKSKT